MEGGGIFWLTSLQQRSADDEQQHGILWA